jgi:hypothetical protein
MLAVRLPELLVERVTGIEPASRKAVSGRRPVPVPAPNGQVRAIFHEP